MAPKCVTKIFHLTGNQKNGNLNMRELFFFYLLNWKK